MYMVSLIFDEVGGNQSAQVCADVYFDVDEYPGDESEIIYDHCVVSEVNYDEYSIVSDESGRIPETDLWEVVVRPDWTRLASQWLDEYIEQNIMEVVRMIQSSS